MVQALITVCLLLHGFVHMLDLVAMVRKHKAAAHLIAVGSGNDREWDAKGLQMF